MFTIASLACLALTATIVVGQHSSLPRATKPKSILTPEVAAFAQNLVETHNTPGLSVGIVQLSDNGLLEEFGSWGNRTDDGSKISNDVCY